MYMTYRFYLIEATWITKAVVLKSNMIGRSVLFVRIGKEINVACEVDSFLTPFAYLRYFLSWIAWLPCESELL